MFNFISLMANFFQRFQGGASSSLLSFSGFLRPAQEQSWLKGAAFFAVLAMGLSFNSCVFEDFDTPQFNDLIDLQGNTTIADIKALHTIGSDPILIPDGRVLEAVVVGNDVSGNIFKELYVQDATGGLVIRIDVNGLNGLYPVGTPVVIRMDGLYIGDFNTKFQLTMAGGDRLPEAVMLSNILRSAAPGELVEVTPRLVTLPELEDNATFQALQNTLIQIDGLQFVDADAGAPFADVPGDRDLNRTLRDCSGNEIVTRTSRFSDFAGSSTPTGNGTVVALMDAFGTTRQLKIREVADFQLTAERCGISIGGQLISIAELRAQFSGSATTASADTKIRGIVISDRTTNNLNSRNLFLQDGNAGILVRFAEDHNFALGTDLEVTVSGLELSEFNGLLQLNNVPLGSAGIQGAGTLPTPREVTVATINANPEEYESTLVKVNMATITGGATFSGNRTVTDATASIPMFTLNGATFATQNIPTGEVSVTAIVSDFNGVQLVLKSAADITGGNGGGGGDPEEITAAELRAIFAGGGNSVPANRFIRGVVISDVASENTTTRNLAIQTGESGITLRFAAVHNFQQNTDLQVSIGGLELSEFNGLLQVNNIPNANGTSMGIVASPTPRVATVAQIIANAEAWESTLVEIADASISGGTTYAGELTVTDASGNIAMFTRNQATFASNAIPGGSVRLIAVVSEFNAPQLFIRNLADVIE